MAPTTHPPTRVAEVAQTGSPAPGFCPRCRQHSADFCCVSCGGPRSTKPSPAWPTVSVHGPLLTRTQEKEGGVCGLEDRRGEVCLISITQHLPTQSAHGSLA